MVFTDVCRLCLSCANEYDSEKIHVPDILKLKTFIPRDLLDPTFLKDHISCMTCLKSIETVLDLASRINKSNVFIYNTCEKLKIKIVRFKHLKRLKNIPNNHVLCRICLETIHVQNIAIYLFESPINGLPVQMVQNMMRDAKLMRVRLTRSDEDVVCHECWEDIQIAYTFKKSWDRVEKKIKSYCQSKKISPFFVNKDDLNNIISLYNTYDEYGEVEPEIEINKTVEDKPVSNINIKIESDPDELNKIEGCEMIIKNEPYEDASSVLPDTGYEDDTSDHDQLCESIDDQLNKDVPPELELQGLCVYNPTRLPKRLSWDAAEYPPTLEPQTTCQDIKIQNVYSLQPENKLMVAISKTDQEKAIEALLDNKRTLKSEETQTKDKVKNPLYLTRGKKQLKSRTLLKCELCDFETFFLRPFERHRKFHENNTIRLYDCDYCNFKSSKKSVCDKHIRSHAKKTVIKRRRKKGNIVAQHQPRQQVSGKLLNYASYSNCSNREEDIGLDYLDISCKKKKIAKIKDELEAIDVPNHMQDSRNVSLDTNKICTQSKGHMSVAGISSRSMIPVKFSNEKFKECIRSKLVTSQGTSVASTNTSHSKLIQLRFNPTLPITAEVKSETIPSYEKIRVETEKPRIVQSEKTLLPKTTPIDHPEASTMSYNFTLKNSRQLTMYKGSKLQILPPNVKITLPQRPNIPNLKVSPSLKECCEKLDSSSESVLSHTVSTKRNSGPPFAIKVFNQTRNIDKSPPRQEVCFAPSLDVFNVKPSEGVPIIQEIVHYGKTSNSEVMSFEVKKETLDSLFI